jgi:hypothetical protein
MLAIRENQRHPPPQWGAETRAAQRTNVMSETVKNRENRAIRVLKKAAQRAKSGLRVRVANAWKMVPVRDREPATQTLNRWLLLFLLSFLFSFVIQKRPHWEFSSVALGRACPASQQSPCG